MRSRRQVFTVNTAHGGGDVDVLLGVNGYIWISKHVATESASVITRLEESTSSTIYSSQNDEIGEHTRREIARLVSLIKVLVDGGVRVDEEMVMRGYEAALEIEIEAEKNEEAKDWIGQERGKRMVEMVLGSADG